MNPKRSPLLAALFGAFAMHPQASPFTLRNREPDVPDPDVPDTPYWQPDMSDADARAGDQHHAVLRDALAIECTHPAHNDESGCGNPACWKYQGGQHVTGENGVDEWYTDRTRKQNLPQWPTITPPPHRFKPWEERELAPALRLMNRAARRIMATVRPGIPRDHASYDAAKAIVFDIIEGVRLSPRERRLAAKRERCILAEHRLKHGRHKSHRRTEKLRSWIARSAWLTGELEA